MVMSDKKVNLQTLTLAGRDIRRVDRANFLGVTIDERLSFGFHIGDVSRKLSRTIGMIGRISSMLPLRIRLNIYNSLVYSRVSYGIIAWGRGTGVAKIDRLLRRAHRYVGFGLMSYDCSRFLNLDSIFRYFTAVKTFKILRLGEHSYFRDLFERLLPSHSHLTRFADGTNFNIPPFLKSKCQRSFLYQAVVVWNSLPDNVKSSHAIFSFKNSIRTFLLENQLSFL